MKNYVKHRKIQMIYNKKTTIYATITLLALITLIPLFFINSNTKTLNNNKTFNTEQIQKPNFDSTKYFSTIIDSDEYLKQHFIAIKYQDSILTPETAIRFMIECNLNEIDINLGVALKETGMRAGVAKTANNLHGLKKANKRFSWAKEWTSSRYCSFDNPYFSFLEMNEYMNSGNIIWSSHSIPQKYRNLIDSLQQEKGY